MVLKVLNGSVFAYQKMSNFLARHSRPAKMWSQYMIPFSVYLSSFIPSLVHLANGGLFSRDSPAANCSARYSRSCEERRHELVVSHPNLVMLALFGLSQTSFAFCNPCFYQLYWSTACLLLSASFPTYTPLCSMSLETKFPRCPW